MFRSLLLLYAFMVGHLFNRSQVNLMRLFAKTTFRWLSNYYFYNAVYFGFIGLYFMFIVYIVFMLDKLGLFIAVFIKS